MQINAKSILLKMPSPSWKCAVYMPKLSKLPNPQGKKWKHAEAAQWPVPTASLENVEINIKAAIHRQSGIQQVSSQIWTNIDKLENIYNFTSEDWRQIEIFINPKFERMEITNNFSWISDRLDSVITEFDKSGLIRKKSELMNFILKNVGDNIQIPVVRK